MIASLPRLKSFSVIKFRFSPSQATHFLFACPKEKVSKEKGHPVPQSLIAAR